MKHIKRRNRPTQVDRHYVNGPSMHNALKEWYESGKTEPPPEVVLAISQICDRLATRSNFKNYSYLDEMIAEGKLACIIAVMGKKYDPYKYNNPFAYFTRVAFNAFVNVIKNEHKEVYIKHKELENCMIEAAARGEVVEYKLDDSGRLDKLITQFEGEKYEEVIEPEDIDEEDIVEEELEESNNDEETGAIRTGDY